MKHIILANWKMSPSGPKEAQKLFNSIKETVGKLRSIEVILAPPALFLQDLARGYSGNKISLAAQAISSLEEVAHTGRLSAEQFANSGAQYCMIGHSERQADETIDQLDSLRIKTFLALKYSLAPVVFIGEHDRDDRGEYLSTVKEQMMATLKELSANQLSDVIFCYEPVWAIGRSEGLDAYDVHAMALYIRKVLAEEYGAAVARKVKVLYGGSVNEESITSILEVSDIDGVAVGRASTDAEQFAELLKVANKA